MLPNSRYFYLAVSLESVFQAFEVRVLWSPTQPTYITLGGLKLCGMKREAELRKWGVAYIIATLTRQLV